MCLFICPLGLCLVKVMFLTASFIAVRLVHPLMIFFLVSLGVLLLILHRPLVTMLVLVFLRLAMIPLGILMTVMGFIHPTPLISWLKLVTIVPTLLVLPGHSGMKILRI